MIDAIPHPDDPSQLLSVEGAIGTLWRDRTAMLALLEGHDDHAKAQDAAITAMADRLASLEELPGVVAVLTDRVAALEDRLSALEPKAPVVALGVDVSGHQTLDTVKALTADTANEYVIVKATEGMTWTADVYPAQRDAAGAKFLGAYHFAWCQQDPVVEADNFLGYAALKPGQVAFLDMERQDAGESWATRVAYLLGWCDRVKARTGATPLVYVNWSWIKGLRTAATVEQWERIVAYPLWLAQWSTPPTPGIFDTVSPKAGSSKGWPVLLHQYGVVGGIDRNHTADLAALKACAVTKEA